MVKDKDNLIERARQWATKLHLDEAITKVDFKNLAIRFPDADIHAMSEFYQDIVFARDAGLFSRKQPILLLSNEESDLFRKFFLLFLHLGGQGCRPFSKHLLKLSDLPHRDLDWSYLPEKFKFAIPYVEKYGTAQYIFSPDAREQHIATLSTSDQAELHNILKRLESVGIQELSAWVKLFGVIEHKEASLIYTFLVMLDGL